MTSTEVHLSWEASVGGSRPLSRRPAATTSDLPALSKDALPLRGRVNLTRLPVSWLGTEADSGSIALPAVRHSSMTRSALKALGRVNQRIVTGSRPSPADMSGMSRPGHHH